jgi:hypothetical protein
MIAVNDPKGEAGSKKAPMWLLPPVALEQTAWVAKLGAEKYGPYNWRITGVCATTYVSAIMRHLNAWRDGEDLDPESGISHIAHIATSCNILMDAAACGTLQDDRNKRPGAGIHGLGFRVFPDIEVKQTTTAIPPTAREEAFRKLVECDLGGPVPLVVSQEPDSYPTDLEAYLDAAGRELLRTASEESPYADQLRRVFAPEPTTGFEAASSRAADLLEESGREMLPGMAEYIEQSTCPWIGLLDKTADFYGVVDVPSRNRIEIGGKLVDLPPVPKGYSRWVDRGTGWSTESERVPCFACAWSSSPCPHWSVHYDDTADGVDGRRYIEAVKDTAVRVVDHDIKPGDQVRILLMHYTDAFPATIKKVVDIRGEKVYTTTSGSHYAESEIYSITHA